MPQPLSWICISFKPPDLIVTWTEVAPASKLQADLHKIVKVLASHFQIAKKALPILKHFLD